jgi:hypothetical protein
MSIRKVLIALMVLAGITSSALAQAGWRRQPEPPVNGGNNAVNQGNQHDNLAGLLGGLACCIFVGTMIGVFIRLCMRRPSEESRRRRYYAEDDELDRPRRSRRRPAYYDDDDDEYSSRRRRSRRDRDPNDEYDDRDERYRR